MNQIFTYSVFFCSLFCNTIIFSQAKKNVRILDSLSQLPIPYTTVQVGANEGFITNEEGAFEWNENQLKSDSITVSSMGYVTKTVAVSYLDSTLYLAPKSFELSTVFVSDKNLPVDEIMDLVSSNLEKNHLHDFVKKRFFYRASFTQRYKKMDFGFQKSTIADIDRRLIDSLAQSIPERASYFFETVCDLYGNHQKEFKLHILKALTLENENQATSFTGFQDKMEQLLRDNVKSDSYLKIKSGIVGQKIPLDSIIEDQKAKDARQKKYRDKEYFTYRKHSLHHVLDEIFYQRKTEVDIITNASRYDFSLIEYQEIQDDLVYVITFEPKWRGDFKGTLYINTADFAVLRLDYQSAKPVYDKKFNMFGIHSNVLEYKGTMLFEQQKDNFYYLKYANQERTDGIGIERPLKIIEKNKFVRGRRKQNEVKLALDLQMTNHIKRELVVYKNEAITENEYSNYKENTKVKVEKASSYNPDFWKDYTTLPPNQLIREYKTVN